MTKPKRVSNAAFDRWFVQQHGKPMTDAQLDKLYAKKNRAEAAFEKARNIADVELERALTYDACLAAWQAMLEAHNG